MHRLCLFGQNRYARFEIRCLNIAHQAPLKTRHEATLQACNFRSGAITAQNELFLSFEKFVEGVEKLLLYAFLVRQKMNVVNQQHVGFAVFAAKLRQSVVLDRLNKFVGKTFRRNVNNLCVRLVLPHEMPDRLRQMGLSEPRVAVNEQRIVGFSGRVRHRCRRRMCQLIAGTHHKRIESILRQ